MEMSALQMGASSPAPGLESAGNRLEQGSGQGQGTAEVREAFDSFVGQTFYGQMLSAMRKTVGTPAYFDGGRAEEVFRSQLDQILAEKMSAANASSFTGPMFQQFQLSNLARGQ